MSENRDRVVGMSNSHRAETPGSTLYPCAACGAQVWMVPSSQRAIKSGQVEPVCLKCAMPDTGCADDIEFAGLLPGAIEETIQHFTRKRRN